MLKELQKIHKRLGEMKDSADKEGTRSLSECLAGARLFLRTACEKAMNEGKYGSQTTALERTYSSSKFAKVPSEANVRRAKEKSLLQSQLPREVKKDLISS